MPQQFSHGDSLREYLTGALVDGGPQADPTKSLGGYRSSTEAVSLGISIANAIANVFVLYASGGNPIGTGQLVAVDPNHLTWQPPGAVVPGMPVGFFGAGDIEIVEALNAPGQYLRLQATPPLVPGVSNITLSYLVDNIFSLQDVTAAQASTGVNQYRATMLRNESSRNVAAIQRWIATLGTPQVSNTSFLFAGAGSTPGLGTTGSYADWPATGWCQIQSSGGILKEVVYYSARTNTLLTVPGNGRAALGTTRANGSATDVLYPVPGVAIGIDPAGSQIWGSAIETIPNEFAAPAGVAWNMGLTAATGLQIGTLLNNTEIGVWIWRQIPAGAVATPSVLTQFLDTFSAF